MTTPAPSGLKFFQRVGGAPDQRMWNIASFHSPHSLTWRWILSFSFFRADEARAWPVFGSFRTNGGLQWIARVPFVGILHWHQQQPVWFRDLYRKARDERDALKSTPTSYGRSPFKPTVIDGGKSLH